MSDLRKALDDAQRLAYEAYQKDAAIKLEHTREYGKRRLIVEQEVVALFKDRLAAAAKEKYEADVALEQARIAYNESAGQFKPGTILVHWRRLGYNPDSRYALDTSAGKGVVEVFHDGDPYIGGRWSMPTVGTLVLRFLKKDGTLGKKCRTVHADFFNSGWYPEGTDPNALTKEAVSG